MEEKEKNKGLARESIPVIFFNSDSQAWEPVDKADEQSRISAKYKNQQDEAEMKKCNASRPDAGYAGENGEKKKNRLPRGFSFFALFAMVLYILWILVQRGD